MAICVIYFILKKRKEDKGQCNFKSEGQNILKFSHERVQKLCKTAEGGSFITNIEHSILKKDETLNNKISNLIDNPSSLNEEFKSLERIVAENVNDTTREAKQEDNLAHNRYKDIGKNIFKILI